jgi:hypothetical protein
MSNLGRVATGGGAVAGSAFAEALVEHAVSPGYAHLSISPGVTGAFREIARIRCAGTARWRPSPG